MSNASVVAVYDSLIQAEQGVHVLVRAGFPKDQISLVMSHMPNNPELAADLKLGDDSPRDAAIGAGLGGVLGVLGGMTMASTIGLGAIFFLGPIGLGVVGSAVGAFIGAVSGWGIHEQPIRHYEECLSEGKVLVITHGSPLEIDDSLRMLKETDVVEVELHARNSSDAPEVSRT